MSKYYGSRARCFSSLLDLHESVHDHGPSLLPWGATFRDIASLSRIKPSVKKDQSEGYQKATILPRSEHKEVSNDTRETILLPELLGSKEVAALLRVSQRTVQRLAKQGALPPPVSDTSKRPKWHEADILALRADV